MLVLANLVLRVHFWVETRWEQRLLSSLPSHQHRRSPLPLPSYSGVDPSKSSLIQGLVEKSAQNKEKNDQARLDYFYRRDFRINRLVGGELLKEPCDPRDPEFGYKCRPLLPRLPQDRMFEETAREKTGFGTVFSAQEVDRAAGDLVAQEAERQDEELSLIEE